MTCEHLRKLYQLCQDHDLKISSTDVVRVMCKECEEIEVCPAMLTDEYEGRTTDEAKPEGIGISKTEASE